MFLRNVGVSTNYTALQPRGPPPSRLNNLWIFLYYYYYYTDALEKLSLQFLRKRRHDLDALFFLFRSIVA
jgi:hypothetical protein